MSYIQKEQYIKFTMLPEHLLKVFPTQEFMFVCLWSYNPYMSVINASHNVRKSSEVEIFILLFVGFSSNGKCDPLVRLM